jgi:hypothetical protein
MKKYILVIAVLLTGLVTSCDKDVEGAIYSENEASFSFVIPKQSIEVTANDNGVVKIPVYRSNKNGEVKASIVMDEEAITENVLKLNTPDIIFKDGESVAYVELGFGSVDRLGVTSKYVATLSFKEGTSLSPSAESSTEITVQRRLTWKDYGIGLYTSTVFVADEEGNPLEMEIPIQKAQEGNIYRMVDLITEGYPIVFSLSDDGQSLLSYEPQPTGYSYQGYMTYYICNGMSRSGNVLTFKIQFAAQVDDVFVPLMDETNETLELPAEQ